MTQPIKTRPVTTADNNAIQGRGPVDVYQSPTTWTGNNWYVNGTRAGNLQPDAPAGITPPASTPQSPELNYQTSIGVDPATDKQVLQGLVSQPQKVDAGSQTGQRAFDDFSRSMNAANSADIGLQADTANAQQHMNAQQRRSEAGIAGLQNQQAIHQNAVDKFRSQLGLATDMEASRLAYLYGVQANSIRRMKNVNRQNP